MDRVGQPGRHSRRGTNSWTKWDYFEVFRAHVYRCTKAGARRRVMGGGWRKERAKPETLDPSTGQWSAGVQGVVDCDGYGRLAQHQIVDFGLAPRGRRPWRRSDFACRSFPVSRTRSASEASGRGTRSAGDVGSRSACFPHIAHPRVWGRKWRHGDNRLVALEEFLYIQYVAYCRKRKRESGESDQNIILTSKLRRFLFLLATIARIDSPLRFGQSIRGCLTHGRVRYNQRNRRAPRFQRSRQRPDLHAID